MATTKTKLVALATIVLGAGVKAREIAPGQEFAIDDDQVQRLVDVGAAALTAEDKAAADKAAADQAAAEKAEADRLAALEAARLASLQGNLT